MEHNVDAVVAGVGTGGTLTGLSRFFARVSPPTEMVLADPAGSIVADYIQSGHYGKAGSWLVEGIGEDFIPPVADLARVKKGYSIPDKEAFNVCRDLLRKEGIMAGTSSGTLIAAALRYCREQKQARRVVTLVPDSRGTATVVGFNKGDASFILIERAGRYGLRVRNAFAKTRTTFPGLDYFDINPEMRFVAKFDAHPAGQTVEIVNVLGMIEKVANPGTLTFTAPVKNEAGETVEREFRMQAVDEGDGRLFFTFADRTSGHETYAASRMVYADPPGSDGTTVLDFNKAYNPPCAFTPYSTCPMPLPDNRLDLRVEAGEKKPRPFPE